MNVNIEYVKEYIHEDQICLEIHLKTVFASFFHFWSSSRIAVPGFYVTQQTLIFIINWIKKIHHLVSCSGMYATKNNHHPFRHSDTQSIWSMSILTPTLLNFFLTYSSTFAPYLQSAFDSKLCRQKKKDSKQL